MNAQDIINQKGWYKLIGCIAFGMFCTVCCAAYYMLLQFKLSQTESRVLKKEEEEKERKLCGIGKLNRQE